jgi:hypothetical protein
MKRNSRTDRAAARAPSSLMGFRIVTSYNIRLHHNFCDVIMQFDVTNF